jgi:hypothetical protein
MWFKELFYGKAYSDNKYCDIALHFFDKSDSLAIDKVFSVNAPENINEIFTQLAADGMVAMDIRAVRITAKGKACLSRGGYVKALLRERITYWSIIVAAVTGIIALIVVIAK